MPDRTIGDRATQLCNQEDLDREDLRLFLTRLIDTRNELRRQVSKNMGVTAGLLALFIILSSGDLTEAELFGLKVQRFTFILLAIPVAAAYTFVNAIVTENAARVYAHTFYSITRRCYIPWRESELDGLLISNASPLSITFSRDLYKAGRGRRVLLITRTAEFVFLTLCPPCFAIYAYATLAAFAPEIPLAATIISGIFTAILITLGYFNILEVEPDVEVLESDVSVPDDRDV